MKKIFRLTFFGAIFSAMFASLCCLGPLLLVLLGVSSAGFFSNFSPLRPIFSVLALGFLGLSFYLSYRRGKAECTDGNCKVAEADRWNKFALWIGVPAVLFFLFFPELSSNFLYGRGGELNKNLVGVAHSTEKEHSIEQEFSREREFLFHVKGLTCSGCSLYVEKALKKLKGVLYVRANHRDGLVYVKLKGGEMKRGELVRTIEGLGYQVLDK